MSEQRIEGMCPHCGWRYDMLLARNSGLVPAHSQTAYMDANAVGNSCPGSDQNPRNPLSDRRPLWKDLTPEKEEAMTFRGVKSAHYRVGIAADPQPENAYQDDEPAAVEAAQKLADAEGFNTAVAVWDGQGEPLWLFMLDEHFKRV